MEWAITNIHVDQLLHIVCKLLWVVVLIAGGLHE